MGMSSDQPAALPRRHSRWEIGLDSAVHCVGIVAGLIGGAALLWAVRARGEASDIVVIVIYSASLIAMFSFSAAYNLGRWSRHRIWLRNLDQAAIFVMIAGNYTPFTVINLHGAWSVVLTTLIWCIAAGGIAIRFASGRLFERVSVGLYLALGWIGLVALAPLVEAVSLTTLALLVTGGLLYTAGIIFHLWERLPFQNAIWHGFVLAGAAVHFAAVATVLAGLPLRV